MKRSGHDYSRWRSKAAGRIQGDGDEQQPAEFQGMMTNSSGQNSKRW